VQHRRASARYGEKHPDVAVHRSVGAQARVRPTCSYRSAPNRSTAPKSNSTSPAPATIVGDDERALELAERARQTFIEIGPGARLFRGRVEAWLAEKRRK